MADRVNTPVAVSAAALFAKDKSPLALMVKSVEVPLVVMSSLSVIVDAELTTDTAPVAAHGPVMANAPVDDTV